MVKSSCPKEKTTTHMDIHKIFRMFCSSSAVAPYASIASYENLAKQRFRQYPSKAFVDIDDQFLVLAVRLRNHY